MLCTKNIDLITREILLTFNINIHTVVSHAGSWIMNLPRGCLIYHHAPSLVVLVFTARIKTYTEVPV